MAIYPPPIDRQHLQKIANEACHYCYEIETNPHIKEKIKPCIKLLDEFNEFYKMCFATTKGTANGAIDVQLNFYRALIDDVESYLVAIGFLKKHQITVKEAEQAQALIKLLHDMKQSVDYHYHDVVFQSKIHNYELFKKGSAHSDKANKHIKEMDRFITELDQLYVQEIKGRKL